jgi:small subunit ribosomal protein S21
VFIRIDPDPFEFIVERWCEFLPKVMLRPGESQQSLLKRFRKKVARSKVLSTVRRKRWFVSESEQRRIDKQKAIRKQQRRVDGKRSRR